jgi:hypothetical protein
MIVSLANLAIKELKILLVELENVFATLDSMMMEFLNPVRSVIIPAHLAWDQMEI